MLLGLYIARRTSTRGGGLELVKMGKVRITPRAWSDMKVQCSNCEPSTYLAQIWKRDANATLDPEQIISCLLKLVTLG
jgi:hypothetical protein